MFRNFVGINFLLQFLRWLLGDLEIPHVIISSFLTMYHLQKVEYLELEEVRKTIARQLRDCHCCIFEICSRSCMK